MKLKEKKTKKTKENWKKKCKETSCKLIKIICSFVFFHTYEDLVLKAKLSCLFSKKSQCEEKKQLKWTKNLIIYYLVKQRRWNVQL